MKLKTLLFTLTAAAALGFTACTENDESTATTGDAATTQTICPVSGEELGSMGEPIVMTHNGKEVKLCCKSCIKKFEAEPEKYTAMVH